MKRFIYNIQYNKKDTKYDMVYVDARNTAEALQRLKKQFPGVYAKHFIRIEKELP